MNKEQLIQKIRMLSTLSLVMGMLTVFCAMMIMTSGWSMWTVVIPAIPAMIFNSMARTYRTNLQNGNFDDKE